MEISCRISVIFLFMLAAGGALWFFYVRRVPLQGNADIEINYRRCRRLEKAVYVLCGVCTLCCLLFIYNIDMVAEKKYWEITRMSGAEARTVAMYDYNFLYGGHLAGIPYEDVIGETGIDCLLREYRGRAATLKWYQGMFIALFTAHSTGWKNLYMISSSADFALVVVALLYDGVIKQFEIENAEVMAE